MTYALKGLIRSLGAFSVTYLSNVARCCAIVVIIVKGDICSFSGLDSINEGWNDCFMF